ncbi:PSD1 and planctomycete cytochrome C domain-containing protein [Isosphaeraceae bacterium EP7]
MWAASFLLIGPILATAPGDTPSSAVPVATPQQAEFFERRIRPILVESCASCHGAKVQKGGIRLDSREALVHPDLGPVVTPGQPEESTLIEVIRREGEIKMPPKVALSVDAVADLTAWVKMGAPWPESSELDAAANGTDASKHWAFQPIGDPSLPPVKRAEWPRMPVDRFILSSLEAKGLEPSRPADKRTLIRRATYDLTGLPPASADVDRFLADDSPDAFGKVVDRLLASPQYGERWARHWLDVSRYADTKGYILFEDANYPWAYTYRDYVIQSFNDDLPYDRFIVEQLAADRLPPSEDRRPLRAMGYLTIGSRFMNNIHDVIDDRIDVVSRGLMGLTVSCARCHDHKFDPIPTKDYYALYGVFASSMEPTKPPLFERPPATPEYVNFARELTSLEGKLAEFVAEKHRELTAGARSRVGDYLIAAQSSLDQPSTEEFMLLADGGDLNPAMITRYRKLLERTKKRHHPVLAPWHALAALPPRTFADEARSLASRGFATDDPSKPVNAAVVAEFSARPPATLAEAAAAYGRLLNNVESIAAEHDDRANLRGVEPGPLPYPALEQLRPLFHGPDAPADLPFDPYGDLALLPDRPAQGRLQELRNAVVKWRTTGPGAPPRAMALEDLASPVEPRVFVRGNPFNPGQPVARKFLDVLSHGQAKPFQAGSGRLELAQAIASRDNPLTARVLVNRVWMHHFGAPLVQTPSDFGLRSDPPTHPELLDHLATRFMAEGWSIKALHRQIMRSAAYQQASDDRPEAVAVDPENALLWRMNRRRLDFEMTRDSLLAVAGRLDGNVGGPSFPDITADAPSRRTLYGFLDRLNLPGLYRTFDFPDPNATSARRDPTTIAPQALFLMNHPFVVGAARSVSGRATGEEDGRIAGLYGALFQRSPSNEERGLAREFLREDGASAASWERYVQALLLSNEFSYLD